STTLCLCILKILLISSGCLYAAAFFPFKCCPVPRPGDFTSRSHNHFFRFMDFFWQFISCQALFKHCHDCCPVQTGSGLKFYQQFRHLAPLRIFLFNKSVRKSVAIKQKESEWCEVNGLLMKLEVGSGMGRTDVMAWLEHSMAR